MNISIYRNRLWAIQVNFAPLFAFFAQLVSRLPHFTGPADDPAALRYIANKYNGEGD